MLRPNKISPKKPCPFCGAFLENEAPSTIWCHPQNSCLLSLRGIAGDEQIAQWDMRYYTTFSIANDPEAVKCLKAPLKEGGYNFEERKEFWDFFFDFKTPKLRLPVKVTKPSKKQYDDALDAFKGYEIKHEEA